MSAQDLCPLCGEGHVTAQVQMAANEYKGHQTELPLHFRQCDTCTSDFAGAAESKLNRRVLMAFRKQVDGLLTGEEITALRKQYQLTQGQAARLFGGGPVAFSKYENDDVAQSEAMDTLLRLVRRSPESFWALLAEKGMESEFMGQSKIAGTQSNVIQMTARKSHDGSPDPRYNSRQMRAFPAGSKQWTQ
jgi:HTH-type transcriptional regulator/antitoxin MqsA